MNAVLYAVYHQPYIQPSADYIIPIQVGRDITDLRLPMVGDDTGNNISSLNKNFSELTAHWWVWKNNPDKYDGWGICHYRRYFCLDMHWTHFKKKDIYKVQSTPGTLNKICSPRLHDKINLLLSKHDLILPRKLPCYTLKGNVSTIESQYKEDHEAGDWEKMITLVLQKYPEYKKSISFFETETTMSFYNMLIAKRNLWNGYLEWLFSILFPLNELIKPSSDPYQQRAVAFMAERLLNLYVYHNQLNQAYLPTALLSESV